MAQTSRESREGGVNTSLDGERTSTLGESERVETSIDVNTAEGHARDLLESVALGLPVGRSVNSTSSTEYGSDFSIADLGCDLEKGEITSNTPQKELETHQQVTSGVTLIGSDPSLPLPSSDEQLQAALEVVSNLHPLPPKQKVPAWRKFRHGLASAYRRLFSVVVFLNLIALVTLIATSQKHHVLAGRLGDTGTAVAANVTGAILMRQEYVINLLFDILCRTPIWMPFRIRRTVAKLYHFGGVHSGCAVSACMWFIVYTALLTKEFIQGELHTVAGLVLTYLELALFVLVCIFALPQFRVIFHNTFESIHRFGGWLAVAIFWALFVVVSNAQSKAEGSKPLNRLLLESPSLWLLVAVTLCIILPWLRLRKVPVRAEILSPHAVQLHFSHINKIKPVQGIRLSTSPLKEWHAFATIPSADTSSFSVIVSNAGDWTKRQIDHPQERYWVRGIPISGVLRMAAVFTKVVLVATGSGIGPCLSMLKCTARMPPSRILWLAPNPLQTFGQDIINSVKEADKDAIIWNTRERKKPDVAALTYHLYVETGAEAVFVISNAKLTRRLVYAMESRGVPGYGPIWDS